MNGRHLAKRVARVALAVLLVAVVAVFVVQAVPGVVGAEHSYVVLSNSMAPEINPGDSVIVGATDPADIQQDDVITFDREADQPPVTHRVTEVIRSDGELAFRTAGDNNEDADPGTVPAEAVIGTVWFTVPLVGHVVQFANQPAGAAVLVGVPIALLILSELWASGGKTTVTRAESDDRNDAVLPRFEDRSTVTAETPAVTDATDETGWTISANELRLGALGFGTFAIYAIYVALQEPTGVSVGVAVGAGIAAAFHLAGLALFAVSGDGDEPGPPADTPPVEESATDAPAADDPLGGAGDD